MKMMGESLRGLTENHQMASREMVTAMNESNSKIVEHLSKPRRVRRDASGRIVEVS